MENLTFKTWLPLFEGFYNSSYEDQLDNDIDSVIDELQCTYDDLEIDYNRFQLDVSKWLTNKVQKIINDKLGIKCKINFDNLYSPKEYNFKNDSINIEIIFNSPKELNKINDLVNANLESVSSYIKKSHTSCDGFTSFHSNSLKSWQNDTNNFTLFEDEYKLGFILEALLSSTVEFDLVESFFYDYEDFYGGSYITNYDDLYEKVENK